MARKTIRRNGRYITIDTKTGKEIKPGTAAWKAAGGLYNRLKKLPGDMAKQAKYAAKDIRDNVIYSDKPDKKGRPQTIAQERVKRKASQTTPDGKTGVFKGPGGNPNKPRQGQAQQAPPAPKLPPKPKAVTPKKVTPQAATPKKLAAPTPTKKAQSSADNMRTWALANKKMIDKVGTKAQKAILAKALKPKEKKKSALAIGG